MVYVISSSKYLPMINKILEETDQPCAGKSIGEQQFFKKLVKENISVFEQADMLILDLTALADTDEELLQGIESIRIMDYKIRFILLAPLHKNGDKFLRECFYAGIYDIITADEYLEISRQLTQCILTGMRYKDALKFRDSSTEDPVPKSPAVQKIIVGAAGTGRRMGCTHNSIVTANFLRQQNQMTAVLEMAPAKTFMTFCEAHKAKIFSEGYFSLNGVDFYPECTAERLTAISGKLYNFIILDFGSYHEADKVLFNKCDVRMIFSGTKPWELGGIEALFAEQEENVLKKYHFCFLGTTSGKLQKEIIEHMQPLENVWFPEYSENPFLTSHFPEGKEIFSAYLKQDEKDKAPKAQKKRLFSGRMKT